MSDDKRLKKLRAFVRTEAKNQPERVKVVEQAIRYITGEVAKPPKRSTHFQYMEEQLRPALHAGNALDDWDRRVLAIWGTGGASLMELSLWLITEAGKYPDDDVMQRFVELAPDVDIKNPDFSRYLPGAAYNSKGKLTSVGRWLQSKGKKLPEPPEPIEDDPPRDTSGGYAIDRYVETLITEFLDDFEPADSIGELSIYIPQSRSIPDAILVDGEPYSVCDPTPALEVVDDGDDDVLAAINEDLDDEIAWGDYGQLPAAIMNYELVNAAHAIVARLKKRVAKVGLLIDDEHFADAKGFAKAAKAAFKKLPKAARAALVTACYANKRSAAWLTS